MSGGETGPSNLISRRTKAKLELIERRVYDSRLFFCPGHPMDLSLHNASGLTVLFLSRESFCFHEKFENVWRHF